MVASSPPMLVDGSEIPFPTTVWMYKNLVNNGISTTNLNRFSRRISEPSTEGSVFECSQLTKTVQLSKVSGSNIFPTEENQMNQLSSVQGPLVNLSCFGFCLGIMLPK